MLCWGCGAVCTGAPDGATAAVAASVAGTIIPRPEVGTCIAVGCIPAWEVLTVGWTAARMPGTADMLPASWGPPMPAYIVVGMCAVPSFAAATAAAGMLSVYKYRS